MFRKEEHNLNLKRELHHVLLGRQWKVAPCSAFGWGEQLESLVVLGGEGWEESEEGQDLSERCQRHRNELLCCASLLLGVVLSSFVSRSVCLAEMSLLGFFFFFNCWSLWKKTWVKELAAWDWWIWGCGEGEPLHFAGWRKIYPSWKHFCNFRQNLEYSCWIWRLVLLPRLPSAQQLHRSLRCFITGPWLNSLISGVEVRWGEEMQGWCVHQAVAAGAGCAQLCCQLCTTQTQHIKTQPRSRDLGCEIS